MRTDTSSQQREYIRHPSSIPLEVKPQSQKEQLTLQLTNVSIGGLSFASPVQLDKGTVIKIRMPSTKPVFKVDAIVQWCKELQDNYELGVQFLDQNDAFRVRMIEQVCHIEEYRKQEQAKRGKRLSKNQASLEWIQKHGASFPHH